LTHFDLDRQFSVRCTTRRLANGELPFDRDQSGNSVRNAYCGFEFEKKRERR